MTWLVRATVVAVSTLRSCLCLGRFGSIFQTDTEYLRGAGHLDVTLRTTAHDVPPQQELQALSNMLRDPDCKMLGGEDSSVLDIINLIQFSYGNTCGQDVGYASWNEGVINSSSVQRCGPGLRPWRTVEINGKQLTVCDDGGLDACCAQHDLARVSYYIPLFGMEIWTGECEVNQRLVECAAEAAASTKQFNDGVTDEASMVRAPMCVFRHLPCVAFTDQNKWRLLWPDEDMSDISGHACAAACYSSEPSEWINVTDSEIVN